MNNLKIKTHIEDGVTYWQLSDMERAFCTSGLIYAAEKSGCTLKKIVGKYQSETKFINNEGIQKMIAYMKDSKRLHGKGIRLEKLCEQLIPVSHNSQENAVHNEAEDIMNFINSVVQEGHPTNIKTTAEILPKDDSGLEDLPTEDTQPQNQLQVITEQEVLGKEFRIYGDFDNPLFLARDVADWIEYKDAHIMLRTVDDEEKIKITTPVLLRLGLQANTEYWFLTEDGLYEVLMQSRKPIAKQFKKEVKQILKTIRKTGGYIPVSEGDTDDIIMAKAIAIGQRIIEEQKIQIAKQAQQIMQLEVINTELTSENENQQQINRILTKQLQEWEKKNAVRRLMCVFANRRFNNNFQHAYNLLYRELRYKKGICLSQRVPKGSKKSLLSTVREKEWDDVLQIAGALCISIGLDIKSILNPVNAEKIPV